MKIACKAPSVVFIAKEATKKHFKKEPESEDKPQFKHDDLVGVLGGQYHRWTGEVVDILDGGRISARLCLDSHGNAASSLLQFFDAGQLALC